MLNCWFFGGVFDRGVFCYFVCVLVVVMLMLMLFFLFFELLFRRLWYIFLVLWYFLV